MRSRKRRKWLFSVMLILGSLLFVFLIAEAGLRILGLSYPLFMRSDPSLGWRFWPLTEGWSMHERKSYLRINAEGFRDGEYDKKKGKNTCRVAVLGDSFIEASSVSLEEAFPKVIEKHLKSCPRLAGKRVECLNFGVSGYGTTQQYLLLQQEVLSYKPDLVILGFFNGNDVGDNVRDLSIGDQKIRPYFYLKDSRLVLDNSFRSSKGYRRRYRTTVIFGKIVNRSYLLQLLKQAYVSWTFSRSTKDRNEDAASQSGRGADPIPPIYRDMFDPRHDYRWEKAWTITEALLAAMKNSLKRNGIDFLLVVIPSPVQAHPVPEIRRKSMEAFGLHDLSYPEKRITDIATRHQISTIMLLEPMRRLGEESREYFYGFPPNLGFGHWNEAGNRVAGELIAQYICKDFIS